MADDFQSTLTRLRSCQSGELCGHKGYIDTVMESDGPYGPTACHGDCFICDCGCVSLDQLEQAAQHRLRTTNKLQAGCTSDYNSDLSLLNAIKRKKL